MEHLTKQQIVLLTLLVSFVTSLSTGIITVSLMDQAPSATRTISQVIERTIQQATPQDAAVGVVSINVNDLVASSTAVVSQSVVRIIKQGTSDVVGLGLISTTNGTIVTDRSMITNGQMYIALLPSGATTTLAYAASTSTIQYMQASPSHLNSIRIFTPFQNSDTVDLGQKVFTLTGSTTPVLEDGLVTEITPDALHTSIDHLPVIPGSPLFDAQGNVVAMWLNGAFRTIPAPTAPTNASSTVL